MFILIALVLAVGLGVALKKLRDYHKGCLAGIDAELVVALRVRMKVTRSDIEQSQVRMVVSNAQLGTR